MAILNFGFPTNVYYNKAMSEMGLQIISFIGALLILIAYAGHQMKMMDSEGPWYNILNFFGSSLLGYVAFFPFKIGFVILEIMWALISLWALFRRSPVKST
jgi:hypothetical protein